MKKTPNIQSSKNLVGIYYIYEFTFFAIRVFQFCGINIYQKCDTASEKHMDILSFVKDTIEKNPKEDTFKINFEGIVERKKFGKIQATMIKVNDIQIAPNEINLIF